MKGFVRIGLSTYQMIEIEPEEMDELLKKGDSQIWPLRFDRHQRVHPVPWEQDVTIFYYENPVWPVTPSAKDDKDSGG